VIRRAAQYYVTKEAALSSWLLSRNLTWLAKPQRVRTALTLYGLWQIMQLPLYVAGAWRLYTWLRR
jgi:hypothetical protein